MIDEALTEPQFDRLQAAVFEQRRLQHLLRQRAIEMDTLRRQLADAAAARSSIKADLTRRLEERERELGLARGDVEALSVRVAERERELGVARGDVEALTVRVEERERELQEARYEIRRAERRLEEAARTQELEAARREVDLLAVQVEERERELAHSDRALADIAVAVRSVRVSRSWRLGHALARTLRTLTFRRRRSDRSALDLALALVENETAPPGRTGRTPR